MTNLEDIIDHYMDEFNDLSSSAMCNPTFLPVKLTGGIGDVIMAIDALRLIHKTHQMIAYTPHIEAFKYFCPEIPCHTTMQNFSWYLEFDTVVRFVAMNEIYVFPIKEHLDLFNQWQTRMESNPRLRSLCTTHKEKYFIIARYAREMGLDRRQFPLHCLGYL